MQETTNWQVSILKTSSKAKGGGSYKGGAWKARMSMVTAENHVCDLPTFLF